jgi:hypothetical protein
MADEILLNNKTYHVEESDLPCLVTYKEKTGGSHFSVTMVADLFLRGSKILFLTAYPMAKDNFLQQINGAKSKTAYVTDENQSDLTAQAIILESGNEKLFWRIVEEMSDINDRVVLVKNMEVFSDKLIEYCLNLPKVILSGDVDKCSGKKQISDKRFKTIIIFSEPDWELSFKVPVLEKYFGYLWSDDHKGTVKAKMGN